MGVFKPRRAAALVLLVGIWVFYGSRLEASVSCGDLDCNGEVTASDALDTLKLAVGVPVASPCVASCAPASTTTTTLGSAPVGAGDLVITEVMADTVEIPDQAGEWVELVNVTSVPIDLRGLELADEGSDSHVIAGPVPVLAAPGEQVVLARNADPAVNGGLDADYGYDGMVLGNSEDEIVLLAGGIVVDRIAYSAGFVVAGASTSLRPEAMDAVANDDPGSWCHAAQEYAPGNAGSPGAANPPCG